MFEPVFFAECGDKEVAEDEVHGYMDKGKSIISLASMLKWMEKVNASSNAKYLKCVNSTWKSGQLAGLSLLNISDITFSKELTAPKAPTTNNIKMAFVESDGNVPAMTSAQAYDIFTKIDQLCKENGIDTAEVGVYLANERGRLTRFSWYYDSDTDTAIVIKNIPWQDASKFLKAGADAVINDAAKKPLIADSVVDELAKIEEQMKALTARRDKALSKLEQMPNVA